MKLPDKHILFVFLVFFSLFGIRLYYVFQKEGLHLDETLSVVLSSCNEYGWTRIYNEDKIYSGKEVRDSTFFENGSLANALSDVVRLRADNRDHPHTNLYYTCLRLWFAGVKSGDMHHIIIRGCLLNMLLFVFSFCLMYRLLRLLFKDEWIVLLGLIVAFLNTAAISATVFIRPYQLQEMLFIWLTLLFVRYYRSITTHEKIDTWQNLLVTALAGGLVLLSGYFAVFFASMYGAVLLFVSFRKKQKQNIPFFCGAFFAAFVFVFAFYSNYHSGFFSDRGQEAIAKIPSGHNFASSCFWLLKQLRQHLFYVAIIIVTAASAGCLLWKKKLHPKKSIREDNMLWILIGIAFSWATVVTILSPFKDTVRYITPALPFLSLVIPLIASKWDGSGMRICVLLCYAALYGFVALRADRINYLYQGVEQQMVFNQKPNVPVIVRVDTVFVTCSLVPYMPDAQKYEFTFSREKALEKTVKYSEVFVLDGLPKEAEKGTPSPEMVFPSCYAVEKFKIKKAENFYNGYHLIKTEQIRW
ncbi:MAG: hypothetical protein LBS09_03310 [Bacteroidales bacterium]|jgi:hypothetical protein|nr:hypothetical protein [Bacteroidales bacterium]